MSYTPVAGASGPRLAIVSQGMVQLSDGSLVMLVYDMNSGVLSLRHTSDRVAVTTVHTFVLGATAGDDFRDKNNANPGDFYQVARDADDNIYVAGINSNDGTEAVHAFEKGVGYAWTKKAKVKTSGTPVSTNGRGFLGWCNTGGGTNNKGHLFLMSFNGSMTTVTAMDAGVALAAAGTLQTDLEQPGIGGANGPFNFAQSGFGGVSGIMAVGDSVGNVKVHKWEVSSAGAITLTAIGTNHNLNNPGLTTLGDYRAVVLRYAPNAYALIFGRDNNPGELAVARFSDSAVLTGFSIPGTAPAGWPSFLNNLAWDVAVDPVTPNKIWIYTNHISAARTLIKRGVTLTSGVVFDAAVTNVTAVAGPDAGSVITSEDKRVIHQPSGGRVDIQTAYTSGANFGIWGTDDVYNSAPNAPTATSMTGGSVVDRAVVNRAQWNFSDPDPVDSQSKFDLDYRLVGAGSWTTITQTTPNSFYDFAALSLAVGDYEWRVRVYDQFNAPSNYSAINNFSAGVAPPAPVILEPINGSTINLTPRLLKWSAPEQDAYQWRRVEDDGGAPDTSVIYVDSGQIDQPVDRQAPVAFSVNNRWEHIQLRILLDGLWSSWASVRVEVSYTEPETPTLAYTPQHDLGYLEVVVTNPPAGVGIPNASYNELYRREVGGTFQLVKAILAPNGTFKDYLVESGTIYEYFVRVVGDNTTTADSAISAAPALQLSGTWLHDPVDPEGTIRQFRYNGSGGDSNRTKEQAFHQFAGRQDPFVEWGEAESMVIDVEISTTDDSDDWVALEALYDREATLVYRDRKGRLVYGVMGSLPQSPKFWGDITSFPFTRVDYQEA